MVPGAVDGVEDGAGTLVWQRCVTMMNVVNAAAFGHPFYRQLASSLFVGTDVDRFDAVD